MSNRYFKIEVIAGNREHLFHALKLIEQELVSIPDWDGPAGFCYDHSNVKTSELYLQDLDASGVFVTEDFVLPEDFENMIGESNSTCKCGEPGLANHTCPYKTDLNGDYDSLCNCCENCQVLCADEL